MKKTRTTIPALALIREASTAGWDKGLPGADDQKRRIALVAEEFNFEVIESLLVRGSCGLCFREAVAIMPQFCPGARAIISVEMTRLFDSRFPSERLAFLACATQDVALYLPEGPVDLKAESSRPERGKGELYGVIHDRAKRA